MAKQDNKYTVTAWDVGIKTLSYCVIEFDKNNSEYWKVLDLGQLNLLSTEDHRCCGKKGKPTEGTLCNIKAVFSGKNINGIESYFCGVHKSQYQSYFNPLTYFKTLNNKDYKCNNCGKIAKYSSDSNNDLIYWCTAHMTSHKKKLIKQTSLCKIKKVTCASENLEQLGTSMYNKLANKPNLFNVNKIKIENQPTLKNPTMKSLSMLLFSYGITQKLKVDSIIENISFIAPSSKLDITFETMLNILEQTQETEKLSTLLTKLLEQCDTKINIKEYKEYFGNKYTTFLSYVAMRVLNKKFTLDNVFEGLFVDKIDEKITKNKIIKILDSLHEAKCTKSDRNEDNETNQSKQNETNQNKQNESNQSKQNECNTKLSKKKAKNFKTQFDCNKKQENKLIYHITKALSVKYAIIELIVTNQNQWVQLINQHTKCDDFTDAILLCLKAGKTKLKAKPKSKKQNITLV